MYCEKCGNKLEDGVKFCSVCGNSVVVIEELPEKVKNNQDEESIFFTDEQLSFSQAAEEPDVQPESEDKMQSGYIRTVAPPRKMVPPKPEKRDNGVIIGLIIVILIAVLLIGFAAFYFITDGELFDSSMFGGEETVETEPSVKKDDYEKNDITVSSKEETTRPSQAQQSTTAEVITTEAVEKVEPDILYNDADYYINITKAVLYNGPNMYNYDAVCVVNQDEIVVVKGGIKDNSEWVYVFCKRNGEYGWIETALISSSIEEEATSETETTVGEPGVAYYEVGERKTVTVDVGEGHNLNLRRQADTSESSDVILLIPDKASLLVLGVSSADSEWYYVEYKDTYGTYYGYVHSDYVK